MTEPRTERMSGLLQARLWWRHASGTERLSTALAIGVVVVLVGWLLSPTLSDDGSTAVGTVGVTPGVEGGEGPGASGQTGAVGAGSGSAGTDTGAGTTTGGTGGAGPASSGSTSGGGSAPTGGGTAAQTGDQCAEAPSGTPGVTDEEIRIGVGILELAGPIGNGAAGVASPDELQRMAEAAVADLNERGGVHCRKIVAKYYKGNPINPDTQRATCLQVIQDRPLLFTDMGAFVYPTGAFACLTQQKVPTITPTAITGTEISRFAPYLASTTSDAATAMYTAVLGAKQMGMFDPAKGFKKLGLLMEDCNPEFNREFDAAIAKAGLTGAQISRYEFSCPPGGFASPSDMGQAAFQHRRDGATHVMMLTGGGSQRPYTQTASGQGYNPKYIFFDYNGMINTAGQAAGPAPNTINGALGVTVMRFGMNTTPGIPVDPATKRCQAIIAKAGLGPEYVYSPGGGGICNAIWAVEAALKGAKTLTREAAIPGLFNAGPVQYAYGATETVYRAPTKFYGGDTWWPIQFHEDCACWRVLDPQRKPSFRP